MLNDTCSVCALAIGLSLGVGCGWTEPTTERPIDETELLDAAELGRQRPVSITDVHVDEALADLCGLEKPTFEVDEARDRSGDVEFSELASCFNGGALQGRTLELFAYTSPEEDTFTRHHGGTRSETVRARLIANGVRAEDISLHDEGLLDEHRVDIRVLVHRYQ